MHAHVYTYIECLNLAFTLTYFKKMFSMKVQLLRKKSIMIKLFFLDRDMITDEKGIMFIYAY